MRFFRVLSDRLRALFNSEDVIRDIDEELRLHIQMEFEANLARGMTQEEARAIAAKQFGNYDCVRDQSYEVRGGGMLETLIQDIKYGARVLSGNKAFTLVAIFTLALGIGANTAIFSVVYSLLMRPLPYPNANRIVMLWERSPRGRPQNSTSRANFMTWRDESSSFDGMAAFSDQRVNLTGTSEPEELSVQRTSPALFHVLGVEPLLGRTLSPDDGKEGADKVAVLGYDFWQRRFGGDKSIVGKSISLNGVPYNVIGVMPAGFQWHISSSSGTGKPAEVWTVLSMPTSGDGALHGRFLSVVALLKPGVSLQQASAEVAAISSRIEHDFPHYNKNVTAYALPLRDQFVGNIRTALFILFGAVGFVLLVACANVANLLLARAAARRREIALRAALGAARWRIVRQLVTESVLLALGGSILGLFFAWAGIRALIAIAPRDIASLQGTNLNFSVLFFTLLISVITGIIFGTIPALEATRLNLNDALKEGGKATGGSSARSLRLRNSFVVVEVALALVLLAGAGLMVRTFIKLQHSDIGFDPQNRMTMVLRLPGSKYEDDASIVAFMRDFTDRVKTLPGVKSAGLVNYLPFYGGLGANTSFTVEGRPIPPEGEKPDTDVRVVDSGYFSAMGIPLIRGRNFSDIENREARHVVLVNQAMAKQIFPGEDPIGKSVNVHMSDDPAPTEIIGIVGDVKYESLTASVKPMVYMPHPELTYEFMTLVVNTSGDPSLVARPIQNLLRGMDPDQPVSDVRSMNEVMSGAVSRERFNTLLLGLFAFLATVLAAVGIFGVMNYTVALRTPEIGLRMALGAQRKTVMLLVLKKGVALMLGGMAVGLVLALGVTRVLSTLLYGVEPTDPITFGAIVVILGLVSLLACYIPARRATRVDPLAALRYE